MFCNNTHLSLSSWALMKKTDLNSLAMLWLINTGKVLDSQWIYSPFRGKVYDAVVESAKPNLTYPNLIAGVVKLCFLDNLTGLILFIVALSNELRRVTVLETFDDILDTSNVAIFPYANGLLIGVKTTANFTLS